MSDPQNRNILVAEDEYHIQYILRHKFQDAGYTVRFAQSVQDALEQLEDWKPDLILSDYQLQDGTGYELCERLHELEGMTGIPIIFLTGQAYRLENLPDHWNVKTLVDKPFSPRYLIDLVGRTLQSAPTEVRPMTSRRLRF